MTKPKHIAVLDIRRWAAQHAEGAQLAKQAVARGKAPEQMALLGLMQTVASQLLAVQAEILELLRDEDDAPG